MLLLIWGDVMNNGEIDIENNKLMSVLFDKITTLNISNEINKLASSINDTLTEERSAIFEINKQIKNLRLCKTEVLGIDKIFNVSNLRIKLLKNYNRYKY